jgi:predicted trehalose synthase
MTVKAIDVQARWFAGKGRTIAAMEPHGGAAGLTFVEVRYEDAGGGDAVERYLTFPDAFAWAPLVARLRAGAVEGDGGRLELRAAPALDGLLAGAPVAERVPATDQSNTLLALGEQLLVKAYRRLQGGPHPEVELLTALAGGDAPVPEFAGSIHWVAAGEETAIALLQAFVPDTEAGWEAPIERAAAALRAGPPYDTGEWRAAGVAAGALHAALVAAFGVEPAGPDDLARWRAEAEAALAEAAGADPDVAAVAHRVRARLAAFEAVSPPQLTRIHGDLHVAQLLRRDSGAPPLIIDFEGDPLRRLSDRRRLDTPLRDLAGLLRSVDHVGSAASRRADGAAPEAWIAAASDATLAGYSETAPLPVDPVLLAALELAKECAELVYAQRVLPEWLYAPRLGLRRLLEDT